MGDWDQVDPKAQRAAGRLKEQFGERVRGAGGFRGDVTLLVERPAIRNVALFLRDDPETAFDFLADLCGVDYLPRVPRFEVVYHLYSFPHNTRMRLKVPVAEGEEVPSVVPVWETANWHERECYDMYGIVFGGHPDLRRIYMPDEFAGFPLRKDFPLLGRPQEYLREVKAKAREIDGR